MISVRPACCQQNDMSDLVKQDRISAAMKLRQTALPIRSGDRCGSEDSRSLHPLRFNILSENCHYSFVLTPSAPPKVPRYKARSPGDNVHHFRTRFSIRRPQPTPYNTPPVISTFLRQLSRSLLHPPCLCTRPITIPSRWTKWYPSMPSSSLPTKEPPTLSL